MNRIWLVGESPEIGSSQVVLLDKFEQLKSGLRASASPAKVEFTVPDDMRLLEVKTDDDDRVAPVLERLVDNLGLTIIG